MNNSKLDKFMQKAAILVFILVFIGAFLFAASHSELINLIFGTL